MAQESKLFPKLLPCPFCGKDPRVSCTYENHIYVGCDNLRNCPVFPTTKPYGTREAAYKAWNTRFYVPVKPVSPEAESGQAEVAPPAEFLDYDYKSPLSQYEIQFAKNAWTSYDDSGEQECGPDTHEERVLIAFARAALAAKDEELKELQKSITHLMERAGFEQAKRIMAEASLNALREEQK